MWKKGEGRFACVPGKSSVATLMNGNVVLNINSPFFFLPKKNEVKVSRSDFFFFLEPSNWVGLLVGCFFSLPCV